MKLVAMVTKRKVSADSSVDQRATRRADAFAHQGIAVPLASYPPAALWFLDELAVADHVPTLVGLGRDADDLFEHAVEIVA